MATPFEPFAASDDQRRTVRAMAGFGVPQEDIAAFLHVDPKTLRKHFRDELDQGVVEANAKVAQSLFNMATKQNNVAAAIFWLKARAGWSERQRIEFSAAQDPNQVSDAELMRVIMRGEREREEEREEADTDTRPSEAGALAAPGTKR